MFTIPMRIFLICAVLLGSLSQRAAAWHIIGGEIYYQHISGNTYLITLKLYRDCYTQGAEYDNPASLAAYDMSGNLLEQFDFPFPGSVQLPVVLDNPCLAVPPNVCVEEAIYTQVVTFDNIPAGGLQIVYQRCCRNATILNIYNPSDVGATYVATILPPATTNGFNSSPYFNNFPPIAICAGEPLVFDHSATDPDGDSLVYEMCTPYQGATSAVPQPIPPDPPPYNFVNFIPPYNVNDQLGGSPPMYVDAETGMLYAHPMTIGQFVVGVCVKEYRDGQLIGTNRRDFQFNVANCDPLVIAKFKATVENQPLPLDTVVVCGELTIDFNNLSIGEMSRVWNFGDPTTNADTSLIANPSYTYPDTGQYLVRLIVNPGTICSDTAYKVIKLHYGLEAGIKTTNAFGCTNSPFQFSDSSVALDGTLDSWTWHFGDGNTGMGSDPVHIYNSPGTYNVTVDVTTDLGCADSYTIAVLVHPSPQLNSGPDDTLVCDLDSLHLFTSPGVSYAWSPDYELSATNVQSPLAAPDAPTTYTVYVTNEFGCIGRDSVVINVVDTVIATAWPDTTVCAGQAVQLFADGAVRYEWHPEDKVYYKKVLDKTFVRPFENSTYLVYSYIGSCVDVDSVQVNVLPIPTVQTSEAQTINQGDTVQVQAYGAVSYDWTPAFSLSNATDDDPFAFPLNTTTYVVTGTAENGCRAVDTTVIYVTHDHYLYIPNAFSPNGDGMNDVFNFYTKGIRSIEFVRIYNRWGEKVYDSEHTGDKAWDGIYRGKQQEIGVYVYVIRAITFDDTPLEESGNVTLMR